MKTIFKYPVPMEDEFEIMLPRGTEILSVQVQRGKPYFWALVDQDEKKSAYRKFRLAGTGHPIDWNNDYRFIGTFQLDGGNLIFHLFEISSRLRLVDL